jgi:hypothetical protein
MPSICPVCLVFGEMIANQLYRIANQLYRPEEAAKSLTLLQSNTSNSRLMVSRRHVKHV